MLHALRFLNSARRFGRGPFLLCLLACLLIGSRLAGEFVCYTCFGDLEAPKTRTFHLHGGGDQERCHHGRADIDPLRLWGCKVNENDPAFVLPEIPRMPVILSVLVPFVLLFVSYRNIVAIAVHSRGPPLQAS